MSVPKYIERIELMAVVFLALALRLYRIGYREFWFDELGQIVVAKADWWHAILGAAKHAGAAPLDYLITHLMLAVGQDEAILRLPAALWGVASVILIYLLARQCAGRPAALAAALILATAPQHVRYSQELRFYSLATMMALLCVLIFWWAHAQGAWSRWVVWSGALAVGLYAHYALAFVGLACGLWTIIYQRGVVWRAIIAGSVAAILFAPWVIYDNFIYDKTALGLSLSRLPTMKQLFYAPLGAGQPVNWLLWILFGLAVVTNRRQRPMVALFAIVGALLFAGAVALDVVGGYPFYQRQALIAMPFLLLAGVCGLWRLLS